MSEKEIAESKVKPYLLKLGFSEELISLYDSVLVRFGTTTGRVDFVCYYKKGEDKLPFLVVEVKTPKEDMGPIQAESYAQRLNAPFFALTNGDNWHWYLTGSGQSNSLRLRDCPVPIFMQMEALTKTERIKEKGDLVELIRLYEDKVKADGEKCPRQDNVCLFWKRPYDACQSCSIWNLVWINWATEELSKLIKNIEKATSRELSDTLGDPSILWGIYPPNIKMIKGWISRHTEKTKETIRYLANEKISIEDRFDDIVSRKGKYHIPGIGAFLASMLFTALDGKKYTIISDRNLEGLKRLNIIDIQPTFMTGSDYANFNDIMLELKELFKDEADYGRSALVHDFTLLVGRYLDSGKWRG